MNYNDILQELRKLDISVFCTIAPHQQFLRDTSSTLNITDLPFGSVAHFATGLTSLIVPQFPNAPPSMPPVFVGQGFAQTLNVDSRSHTVNIGPLMTCCAAVFFAGTEIRGKYQQLTAYHVPAGIDKDRDSSPGIRNFVTEIENIWSTLSARAKANSRFLWACPLLFDENYLRTIISYARWLTTLGVLPENICVFDSYNFEGNLRVELNGYFGVGASHHIVARLDANLQKRQIQIPHLPALLAQINSYKRSPEKKHVPSIMLLLEECHAALLGSYDPLLQPRLNNIVAELKNIATQYAAWRDERESLNWWNRIRTSLPYKAQADIFDNLLRAIHW